MSQDGHPSSAEERDRQPQSESSEKPAPPVAGQRPHSVTHHGVTLEDPWQWLRDPGYPAVEDPEVLAYLNAENDYFDAMMTPHQALIDVIFEEIKARQQPDLSSVPWRRGRLVLPVAVRGGGPVQGVAALAR